MLLEKRKADLRDQPSGRLHQTRGWSSETYFFAIELRENTVRKRIGKAKDKSGKI
ncbi:MAG: hypothetical protein ACYCZ1_06185 [Candidatus Humimicrobiaceae bacterium]